MSPTEPPYTPLTGLTKIKIKKVEGVLYPGGALGYFLGGYVAPGFSKLAARSKKTSPKIDIPFQNLP